MFRRRELVRFQHCDPAGIVFYPRYVEMINATVEDWFESMGLGFAAIHIERGIAIPAVSLAVEFRAPSRLGDVLDFELGVLRIGNSSVSLSISASCENEARFQSNLTLVHISKSDYRPGIWPEDIRVAMMPFVVGEAIVP